MGTLYKAIVPAPEEITRGDGRYVTDALNLHDGKPIPIRPRATSAFVVCDTSGLCDAYDAHRAANGGREPNKPSKEIRNGAPHLTAAADAYFDKFNDAAFMGKAFENINAMTGGVPNVAAYLAGQPLNMRQRHRRESPKGPLLVCYELTGTAGISAHYGAAMMALVRLLAASRPIELWTLTT